MTDADGQEPSNDAMDDTLPDDGDEMLLKMQDVSDNFEAYWPEDDKFHPVTVVFINDDEKYNINCEDGDKETPDMINETVRFSSEEEGTANTHTALIAQTYVTSSEKDVLQS